METNDNFEKMLGQIDLLDKQHTRFGGWVGAPAVLLTLRGLVEAEAFSQLDRITTPGALNAITIPTEQLSLVEHLRRQELYTPVVMNSAAQAPVYATSLIEPIITEPVKRGRGPDKTPRSVRASELPKVLAEQTILNVLQVEKLVGLSQRTILRMVEAGTFPRFMNTGIRKKQWFYGDVQRYLDRLATVPAVNIELGVESAPTQH